MSAIRGRIARAMLAVLAMAGLLVAVGVTAAFWPTARVALHRLDSNWLGERVMDTMTRIRGDEDWSRAAPLRPAQDYGWLRAAGRPVRIAHALGAAGRPTANTLGAMRRAYAAGFRLLEVDLVDEGGELHCQHDPGPQGDLVKDGCTLDTLLEAVPPDAWLVLDIKTDFAAVGQRIVDRVTGTADAKRIVFQLYRPGDFALFNRWQEQASLPGPILTAYLAHRRIDHVATQASRIGVTAFTLPLDRLPALTASPIGATVLAHPVHNCAAWAQAVRRAGGVYTLSSLRCGASSQHAPSP
ncbi:hypothetical protein [Roseateles sp. BYS96W]|uniref:Glycerophosphodiester phosphodiesterase n=1 Tax=Pelomonas nitida TaxID=3299027 RepID=A0ABW7G4Z6_9BURK